MPLSIGTRLGPYEILAHLGSGGMGEVYRGRDTRLNREVAIKVLPAFFAAHSDRLNRFELEAKATGALNHPNILTVHDIGIASEEFGGSPYIVAELLEGEELRARLNDGALPVRQAVEYAHQIAAGLAAAHEKGITHRDLKPENLFITRDGRVKILDFGLAKLKRQEEMTDNSNIATQDKITNPGIVMGTFAYMSPEQARGEVVDHRSDLFSLGLILFEMLRGQRAFQRETMAETITAIMKDDVPELSAPNTKISLQLEKIVRRCLEKRPERRFQTASDLGFALEALSGDSGSTSSTRGLPVTDAIVSAHLPGRKRLVWAGAILALGAVAGACIFWMLGDRSAKPVTAKPVRRMMIQLPANEPLALAKFGVPHNIGRSAFALSPDGTLLVYAGEYSGKSQLYLRSLDQFEAKRIPGTENAYDPFFSPDGRQIGFFAGTKLKTVSLQGGEPDTLCEVRTPYGATWGPDGTIVFADREGVTLSQISVSGGKPEILLTSGDSRPDLPPLGQFFFPEFLPGGKSVLFSLTRPITNPDSFRAGVYSLETGKWHPLVEGATNARYAASGHIVFVRGGRLFAAPFDLSLLKVTGPAIPLIEGIRVEEWGAAQFAMSPDGTLVYASGSPVYISKLTWVDRSGVSNPVDAPPQSYGPIQLSPDGKRLAVIVRGATTDVWVYEFARGTFTRLTVEEDDDNPRWTPDGKRLTFTRINGSNQYEIVRKLADGSGGEEVLASSKVGSPTGESFSPDGKLLAFTEWGSEGGDLWVLPLDGDRKPQPWLKTKYIEWGSVFSRDGKYIAYVSDESGRYEVYVRSYPGPGGKWQISTGGAEEVIWSRDGGELFYREGQKFMSVKVQLQPEFHAEPAKLMFEGPYMNIPGVSYDVAPDGHRFIMLEESIKRPPTTDLNVVLNWFEELKQRVPVTR